MPLNETLGFEGASLLIERAADLLPTAVGPKVMLTAHEFPGAIGAPQVLD
jgi:hypothetical protein